MLLVFRRFRFRLYINPGLRETRNPSGQPAKLVPPDWQDCRAKHDADFPTQPLGLSAETEDLEPELRTVYEPAGASTRIVLIQVSTKAGHLVTGSSVGRSP